MSVPYGSVLWALAALCVVLGLVVLAAKGVRATGLARSGMGTGIPRRGGARTRLSVEEAVALDRVRRVVLVRCDGRELLLLTGGPADVVLGWLPTAILPPAAGECA